QTIASRPLAYIEAAAAGDATIRVHVGTGQPVAEVVYVPVVPFPTYADDVSWAAIQQFWAGNAQALTSITNDGSMPTLYVAPDTRAALENLLGTPAPAAAIQ